MINAHATRPLFTSLITAVLLISLQSWQVLAQPTEQWPTPVQSNGQTNQQASREEALAEVEKLNQQLTALIAQGRYNEALLKAERQLAICEQALDKQNINLAVALSNVAVLSQLNGDYTIAEPLLQRALTIFEKAPGGDTHAAAVTLQNLGFMYVQKGDYMAAERPLQHAVAILERALNSEHPDSDMAVDFAVAVSNLGALYRARDDYAKAEQLYQGALTMLKKARGGDHPEVVAGVLNNLAGLYLARDDYAEAEPLYQGALTILKNAQAGEHPAVVPVLGGLAYLYTVKGEYAKAEPLLQHALAISENVLGGEHPTVITVLSGLAALYEAKGDRDTALRLARRISEIREKNLALILTAGSEEQKRLYLATLSGEADAMISLHLQLAPHNTAALRLALTTILRRKGRILDVMADQIGALRRHLNEQDRALLDQLSAKRSRLSDLVFNGAGQTDPSQHRAEIARLETDTETLEAQVSSKNAEFRVKSQPVTIERVQQAIPAGAALVELVSYQPFNTKSKTMAERWGQPHYAAYVLRRQGAPSFVDLGAAAPIEKGVSQLRAALPDPKRADVKQAGRALDEMLMRPIRELIGDARQLLISPDGALNLIPFSALVDENNHYLVENYSISYLTSGRDLLRLEARTRPRERPVIIANPLFDPSAHNISVAASKGAARPPVASQIPASSARRSVDLALDKYEELKETATEAQAIAALLPGAKVLTGANATESALKQVTAPRILHIATHGFFLPDQPEELSDRGRGAFELNASNMMARPRAVGGENPLLRSGLVLAGANRLSDGTGEDGVLTALEAAGLDLWGTKLVVLSACQTGEGEVQNGEGVYGLRRALVLAGAESELISLWRVDDPATRYLMIEYYKRLEAGEGRAEALRQVQLKMLRSKDRNHPFYWASFIPVGDWRNLEGK